MPDYTPTADIWAFLTAANNAAALASLGAASTTLPTFGATGIKFAGSTSGNATLLAPAVAGTASITLPGVTGTLAVLGANAFTGAQSITPPSNSATVLCVKNAAGTTRMACGGLNGADVYQAVYLGTNAASPSSTNYTIAGSNSNGNTYINSSATLSLLINDGAKMSINTTGIGFYSATPVARAAAITAPTGGATVDTECRAAVASIITAIKNIGITS